MNKIDKNYFIPHEAFISVRISQKLSKIYTKASSRIKRINTRKKNKDHIWEFPSHRRYLHP